MISVVAPLSPAMLVDRAASEPHQLLRQTSSFGLQSPQNELRELCEECAQPGWDGYGAQPVSRQSVIAAGKLLNSLPYRFPLPTIGIQPDGLITMEWYHTPRRTLSVCVGSDGRLHYACLNGTETQYGSMDYFDLIPEKLLQLAAGL